MLKGGAISTTIVRGKHVITRALDRHRWEQIDDGAVLQQNGAIMPSRICIGTILARPS